LHCILFLRAQSTAFFDNPNNSAYTDLVVLTFSWNPADSQTEKNWQKLTFNSNYVLLSSDVIILQTEIEEHCCRSLFWLAVSSFKYHWFEIIFIWNMAYRK
jgi:hypothetical protein